MARYLSLHSLACLTRQGAEELVGRLVAAPAFRMRRAAVSLVEAKLLVEYDAPDRAVIEEWLARERFHLDWLLRVDLETRDAKLYPPEAPFADV